MPRKNRLKALTGLALLSLACVRCATSREARAPGKAEFPVILISIDGLRPEFYTPNSGWDAPVLQALAARGARAESAEPVYPSVTYSNHATLLTGVYAAEHGVLSNTVYSPEHGSTAIWYWDSSHVKAPTIWARAQAAGYTTAILTWPATVGAKVNWLLPEIFASPPVTTGSTWALMRDRMDPALIKELERVNTDDPPEGFEPRDRWVAGAAAYLLKQKKPDFTLIHLIGVDKAEHDFGMNAPESKAALREADVQLGRILATVDPARTTILLVGDHGFYDFDKLIRPATLWAREPWASKVDLHPAGGAAAVYIRGSEPLAPKEQAQLMSLLKRGAGSAYRIIGREELDRLHAFPGALCALDPLTTSPGKRPGYSISPQTTGSFIEKLPQTKGNHGPLATSDPHLLTGFLAAGPGITPGSRLGRVRLLDVAPTIASMLGVPFPEAQGRPMDLNSLSATSAATH